MVKSNNTSLIILFCSILTLPVSMSLSGVFLLILLGQAIFDKVQSKQNPVQELVPVKSVKLWFLFIFFSLVQGIITLNPLFHYGGLIGHYLLYWIIFWMISLIVNTSEDLKKLIIVVASSGAFISIIGFLAYSGLKINWQLFYFPIYGGEYLLNLKLGEYSLRASSFAMNPNIYGCFLLLTIFFTLSLFENDITTRINLENGKKYFYAVLLFLQSSALILSGSRGAIVSLFTGLILYYFFRPGKSLVLFTFISSFILIFTINFGNYFKLMGTIADPNYSSNQLRIGVYETSMDIIKDFPMGVGILNYENIYPSYHQANTTYLPHAHNWYLHTAIESGILGAIIFFLFFFSVVIYIYVNLLGKYPNIFLGLVIFSVFNFTDYVLTDTRICVLLTILIFTGLKLVHEQKEN